MILSWLHKHGVRFIEGGSSDFVLLIKVKLYAKTDFIEQIKSNVVIILYFIINIPIWLSSNKISPERIKRLTRPCLLLLGIYIE